MRWRRPWSATMAAGAAAGVGYGRDSGWGAVGGGRGPGQPEQAWLLNTQPVGWTVLPFAVKYAYVLAPGAIDG